MDAAIASITQVHSRQDWQVMIAYQLPRHNPHVRRWYFGKVFFRFGSRTLETRWRNCSDNFRTRPWLLSNQRMTGVTVSPCKTMEEKTTRNLIVHGRSGSSKLPWFRPSAR